MRRRIGRKRRGKKEGGGEGKDCGDADEEEEEREKDEEMRGRAADSGISRKVSAVSRRRVLGTDRFLDEPRQRNRSAQNHRGTDRASKNIGNEKRAGVRIRRVRISLSDIASLNTYKN